MDKIFRYFQVVDPFVLVIGIAVLFVVLIIIPAEKRWLVPFAFGPTWMLVNRMSDFQMIGSYMKVLAVAPTVAMIFGVITGGFPKSKTEPAAFVLILTGVFWIVCIAGTNDFGYGFAVRIQWILMCVAASLVLPLLSNLNYLRIMLRWLYWGYFAAGALMLAAFAFDGGVMYLNGHTRFSPWGSNPNQINMTLTMVFFLSLYMMQTDEKDKKAPIYAASAIASAMMLLLTISRSSIAMAFVGVAIIAPHIIIKRPLLTFSVAVLSIVVSSNYVLNNDISLNRLNSLQSGREDIAVIYLNEIMKRPISGLLGTSGRSFNSMGRGASHAHNAILAIAYNGGILLLLPFLVIGQKALTSCLYLFRTRKKYNEVSTETTWMVATFVALVASSFNNFAIIWSSYFESFLVLLVGLFAIRIKTTGYRNFMRKYPAIWSRRTPPIPAE